MHVHPNQRLITPYLDPKVLFCDIEVEFQGLVTRMEGTVDITAFVLRSLLDSFWTGSNFPANAVFHFSLPHIYLK